MGSQSGTTRVEWREIVARYQAAFRDQAPIQRPPELAEGRHAWHLYCILWDEQGMPLLFNAAAVTGFGYSESELQRWWLALPPANTVQRGGEW